MFSVESSEQLTYIPTAPNSQLPTQYTSKFLDNQYLKYIGWALFDKAVEVRLVALEAIDALYNSSLIANLEAFTTRFRFSPSTPSHPSFTPPLRPPFPWFPLCILRSRLRI